MNDLSFSQVDEVKCRVLKIWSQFYVNDILYKQSDFVFLNTFQMKTNRDVYTKEDEVLSKFLNVILSEAKKMNFIPPKRSRR